MAAPPSKPAPVALTLLLAQWPGRWQLPGAPPRELGAREAALLAWLALEGDTPRARLAAVLWPDSDEQAQRNALRQRLFQLKKQIGIDVAVGSTSLALAEGVVHDLGDADTVLGSSSHDHSDAFAQWLAQQRQQRLQRGADRLVREADAAEQARDYDRALDWARQALARERASEVAHRRVMRLHYLRGDRAAALLAFDECERMLKHEVGTRPDAQTMALLAMIESATTAAPPPPLRGLPPGVLRPPQLIDRASSLQQLLAPLQQGQHVLLLAEAGLGKTRLLEECASVWAGGGGAVARAGARPGDATRPFALLARVLQVLVPQPAALPEEARQALAWVVPAFGPTPSGALQVGPFEAAVAQVLAGSGVLLLDDLHFADAASIELLLRCSVDPACRRCVLAARLGELPAALQAWRSGTSVGLQPAEVVLLTLAEDGIAALVDSLGVDGLSGAALAPTLARHTGGNPQFVLETVKALLLANAAAPGSTSAQDFASGNLPLPRTVGRLIHQRLRQLSPGALKLARLAAVAGQDLSPALASDVLKQGLLDLADPWAELEAAGVLRGSAFAHDLVWEGTLETMPQVLAATLHDAVAQWLAVHEGEAARIATHLRAAGKAREAVPWLMKAAAHASARIQLRDAAQFCEDAADICREAGDAAGELAALEAAVDALFDVELGDRMERLLQRLRTMALPDADRARALRSVAAVRHFRMEDEEATVLGEEALALALATQQPALEFRIRYGLVQVLSYRRLLPRAQEVLQPARDWVAAHGDAVQRLQLACMEGWVLLGAERFEPGCAAWRSAQQQAAALERPRDEAMALNHLQVCLSLMGRFAEGHEVGLRELAIVRRHRLAGTRNIYLDLNLSISALLLGRYAESIEALERARAAGVLDQATLHLRQAALNLQMGQPARCLSELRPLLDGSVAASQHVVFNACLLQMRWLLGQEGTATRERREALQQALARATELARGTQRVEHRGRLLLARGRLAEGDEQCTLLTEAAAHADRHMLRGIEAASRAHLAQALAAAGDDAGALAQMDRALALRDSGHVVDQMPGVELDALAVPLLARLDPARGAAVLARALAWIDDTARTQVPEAFRHGFLHVHPAHRQLRAWAAGGLPLAKSPDSNQPVPLRGQ